MSPSTPRRSPRSPASTGRRASARTAGLALFALVVPGVAASGADAVTPFSAFAGTDVVRIVTRDADGEERDTSVWIAEVDGALYVRTNDSRWLANIRRGSPVALRLDATTLAVSAEEVSDPAVTSGVEAAFKAKYGLVQRVMSFFRMREPTVLRLRERAD